MSGAETRLAGARAIAPVAIPSPEALGVGAKPAAVAIPSPEALGVSAAR